MSNELPYEVYDCQGELVGAFPSETLADDFVEDVCWLDGRKPLEIVGPGERGEGDAPDYDPADVAFDEPVSNPYKLPRLVETEPERPTLDQMPEWERHLCRTPNGNVVWLMSINGDAWYAAYPPMSKVVYGRSEYTVLDAPAPQRTVKDLRPGDVVLLDGEWWICTAQFNLVGLETGAFRSPRDDTPIDKVYRFEVAS